MSILTVATIARFDQAGAGAEQARPPTSHTRPGHPVSAEPVRPLRLTHGRPPVWAALRQEIPDVRIRCLPKRLGVAFENDQSVANHDEFRLPFLLWRRRLNPDLSIGS